MKHVIPIICAAITAVATLGARFSGAAPSGECLVIRCQSLTTNTLTIGEGQQPPVQVTSMYILDMGSGTWRTNTFTWALKKAGTPASAPFVPILTDSFTNGMYVFAPANILSFGWGDQLKFTMSDTNYMVILNR